MSTRKKQTKKAKTKRIEKPVQWLMRASVGTEWVTAARYLREDLEHGWNSKPVRPATKAECEKQNR